ncbi:MAG: HAD family hydrolase [Actinobacteria bacterium]|nr:MAG: HAD family hydrolase [Actinomycetota bacterium]
MTGTEHFEAIGFDADDTLWFSEDTFRHNENRFVDLVSPYAPLGIDIKSALVATERVNIGTYGYGVKSFGLSAVEAAITITNGTVPVQVLQEILRGVREHLTEPVRLFDGVAAVLSKVAQTHRLILITKGDLVHQTRKVDTSGLAHYFDHVEIVLEKDPNTYRRVLATLHINPHHFCMVGNSLHSDIMPVLAIGGFGAYVPYEILWELDQSLVTPTADDRFVEIAKLADFPEWLARISR